MSQTENAVTSSSGTKRAYRKGNPLTLAERQQASLARKRATHKVNRPGWNPLVFFVCSIYPSNRYILLHQ